MFKFGDLKELQLEITNNCQARCPMCPRNINGGLENPLIKTEEWTLEDFKIIMNPKVLNQIECFHFCGNFGDPMMNDDVIDMCQYTADTNPNVFVQFHTNGGARKSEWWERLAKAMPKNHRVVFAIDGLEDTHSIYRIGTKYETVIANAQAFIKAGGIAEWAFIKFKHNEHQIEEIKQRSKDLGFAHLSIKNSFRFLTDTKFPVLNKNGSVDYFLETPSQTTIKLIDKETIKNWNMTVQSATVECRAEINKGIYIDAYKDFYACCYLGTVPFMYIQDDITKDMREKMVEQHHAMVAKLGEINTLKRSIEDILNSSEYQEVWHDMWHTNKSHMCVTICGKHSGLEQTQFWDQWEEYTEPNKDNQ
jgi:MoaA/NifB/PqqE/SkfB family radical SAM enzyme